MSGVANADTDVDAESFKSLFQKMMAQGQSEDGCMISKDPLDDHSAITLDCGHVFNYVPLFKELCRSKTHKKGSIACPYCRVVTPHTLPLYIHDEVMPVIGVNTPSKSILPKYVCTWTMKAGPNKGQSMCKRGGIIRDGVPHMCTVHYNSLKTKLAKEALALEKKKEREAKKAAEKAEKAEKKAAEKAEKAKKKAAEKAEKAEKKKGNKATQNTIQKTT
jgi:hypothetical protein